MWVEAAPMLAGGLAVGLAFGWLLQKGGVSRYPVIVGQFLFTDFTVLKVMFTAIVVGAIGVAGLLELGVLSHLIVKPATLVANALGGLIFGVGMVGVGYCPGTCVAAAGEGSRHAWYGILGMLAGAALFAGLYPALEASLIAPVDWGKVTLPELIGVSRWWVVAGLVAVAGAVFAGVRAVEGQGAAR